MKSRFSPPTPRPFLASALFYLILLNVAIFVCQSSGFLWEHRPFQGMIELMQFGSLAQEDIVERFQWWRIFTYMFVHDVPLPLHVGLNMLMVFICGRVVQAFLGGRAVVLIYLIGGVVGALAHVALFTDPVVGASAAAYALLVAMAMLVPEKRVLVLLGLILPVRMRIKYLVYGMLIVTAAFFVIDLVAGAEAEIPMISGIGHLAHLGGAFGGYLFCKIAGVNRLPNLADLEAQRAATGTGNPSIDSGAGGFGFRRNPLADPELEGFSMTSVDPILDKIAREGFLSLTEEERDHLQLGMRSMSRT